jgi:endonuclease/exonuclease/phosphatase family metal-dependent hydrolase
MRICTWNIHAWGDAAGRGRVDDVIDVLHDLNADVVALNEVLSAGGALLRLASVLDKDVWFGPAGFGGNAVLAPRGSTGRSVALVVRGGEARSAVVVQLASGISVVGVHLDHRRETVRCAQLRRLLDDILGLGPHVVAGDLNAIDPDDSPAERFEEIERVRARHGLEPSSSDVVSALRSAGYVDAARARGEVGPLPEALRSSCHAGTRVDHVWLDAALAKRAAVVAVAVPDVDASDHRPVVVDLELAR